MLDKTFIALDFPDLETTKKFISKVDKRISRVKVGMELFYSEGFEVISFLKEKDFKIFLDLKLHDIPQTVFKALKVIDSFDVEFTNVHCLGGKEMLSKSQESLSETKLLGVTILTSHDHDSVKEIKLDGEIDQLVESYHQLSYQSGLSGIVCSAQDLKNLKKFPNFNYVTPGIRLNNQHHDQKRVMSPREAFENGASHIVMGREVTRSEDPNQFLDQLEEHYERNS